MLLVFRMFWFWRQNQHEREKEKQMPAGDDDYSRGVFEVCKSLSPPLNINKQLAAVTNTDTREINCGDRDAYRESQKEENDHNRDKDREEQERDKMERDEMTVKK